MKVNELRVKLKDKKKAEIEQLFVEVYKQIPKKVREGKEIDQLINNPDAFKKARKNTKQSTKNLDFTNVDKEVRLFIKNAYDQNYFTPNRMIPKKERSNWRFTAKRLVNQLMELSGQEEHVKACTSLMEELYKLFCYASGHYVFTSQEPFHTINSSQPQFFKQVVMMKKRVDEPREWIHDSLRLMLDNGTDRDTPSEFLSEALLEALTNAPLKEEAVKIADNLLQEKEATVRKINVHHKEAENYDKEDYINHLVETIFMIQSALGEYQAAVRYFNKHYIESITREIRLYVLLRLVMRYQRVEDWMSVYEKAIKRRINPRDSLKKAYEHIKRTGEFPRFIG